MIRPIIFVQAITHLACISIKRVLCISYDLPLSFVQMEVFPYAVFYMFFEQYLSIWRTALINLAIAIGQCHLSVLNLMHLSADAWYNFDYMDILKKTFSFYLLVIISIWKHWVVLKRLRPLRDINYVFFFSFSTGAVFIVCLIITCRLVDYLLECYPIPILSWTKHTYFLYL